MQRKRKKEEGEWGRKELQGRKCLFPTLATGHETKAPGKTGRGKERKAKGKARERKEASHKTNLDAIANQKSNMNRTRTSSVKSDYLNYAKVSDFFLIIGKQI